MTSKKHQTILWIIFTLTLIGALLLGLPASMSRASNGLPSRATPTPPSSSGGSEGSDKDDSPVGAYIELHAPGAPAGAWAVVQWQNELGDWYDVKGWRGTLDKQGRRRWWVAEKDFGTGPFRWVVIQGQDGQVLGSSAPFNLPSEAYQTLLIELKLGS